MLDGHGALGLALAALIQLVCLSGALAVFLPDLARWEAGAPAVRRLDDAAVARAAAEAFRAAPDASPVFIDLPTPANDLARVTAVSSRGTERRWMLGVDGRLIAARTPWSDFLHDLHVILLLPRTAGRLLVGLTGTALLSLLLSGVLAHPRILRDAFHLRWGRAGRLAQADLHNRAGVWALPFHLTIAFTGASLGLATVFIGAALALAPARARAGLVALAPSPRVATGGRPAMASVLAAARRLAPEAMPSQVILAASGPADGDVTVVLARPRLLVPQEELTFSPTGVLTHAAAPGAPDAGRRWLGGVGQLHFGWFGGAAVRLFYGALGVVLCVSVSSGVRVWLSRRREQGRPAPVWERSWAAVAWGQPLALALALLLAPVLAPSLLWATATIVALASSIAALSVPGDDLAVLLRRCTGLVLTLAVLVHSISAVRPPDASGWIVTIGLLAVASALVLHRSHRNGGQLSSYEASQHGSIGIWR